MVVGNTLAGEGTASKCRENYSCPDVSLRPLGHRGPEPTEPEGAKSLTYSSDVVFGARQGKAAALEGRKDARQNAKPRSGRKPLETALQSESME